MRALFTGLVAAALVGCATIPDEQTGAVSTPTASKVDAQHAKPTKTRRTKLVAKAKPARLKTASRVPRPKAPDPATEKAKAAIAAMLPEPASAEFYNLRRSKKKLLHKTMDTICGYVRTKNGSGKGAREMPFLYTVNDDQAYLVNSESQVAVTVHGTLCK